MTPSQIPQASQDPLPPITTNTVNEAKAISLMLKDLSPFHFDVRKSEPDVPEEVHRSLQYAVTEGALAGIMAVFIGGVVLTGLALALGANDFVIGVIAAIQAGANLLQIRAFHTLERRGHRRRMAVKFAAACRLMWVPICALIFITVEPFASYRIWIFLVLFALSVGLGVFSFVPWVAWLVELVPQRIRGRFFAQRNLAAGAVGVVFGIGAGKFIDVWNEQTVGPPEYAFAVLIVFGMIFGFWAVATQNKMYEPPFPQPKSPLTFLESLKAPFSDINFRRVFYFRMFYDLSLGMAGTFYGVYMLTQVGLSFTFVSAMVLVSTLANLLSLKMWGRMLDTYGNKPVLYICLIGKFVFAALWLFTSATTFWLYIIIHLFGIFDAGNSVAVPNLVYKIAPAERRANYITVDGTVVGIAATVAPLIGGSLAVLCSHWSVELGGFHLAHFHFLFLASVGMRAVTFYFLKKVQETESASLAQVISVIEPIRSINVFEGFQFALRTLAAPARFVMKKLAPKSSEKREQKKIKRSGREKGRTK
ncbi:MAG: MFS transporter [Ignavibacteriales bacterium]|nr:MFS transporter [Ignavibacteriales bacterium]